MVEKVIVLAIVGIALFLMARRGYRSLMGRSNKCACDKASCQEAATCDADAVREAQK